MYSRLNKLVNMVMMLGAMVLTMKKVINKWGMEENKKESLLKMCVCEYVPIHTCVYSMPIYIYVCMFSNSDC